MTEAWFDDHDDAQGFVAAHGLGAALQPVGFAEEDDSEDRAWLVVIEDQVGNRTDLTTLVESFNGWIPDPSPQDHHSPTPLPPLPLPTAPRRIKRSTEQQS